MACFPDTCVPISQNVGLGDVLLLLLGDSDPPALLEMCRLLLTCLTQPNVAPLWLQRIQQQTATCVNLCFIMSSSTNGTVLHQHTDQGGAQTSRHHEGVLHHIRIK